MSCRKIKTALLGLALSCLCAPLAARPNIAVLELTGNGVEAAGLAALANRLRSDLVQTDSFTVLEREEMNNILKEQGFQQTGCTDAECAVEMGRLLNVEYMVSGSVDRVGNIYSVNVRMIGIKTGDITKNVTADCHECRLEEVFIQSIRWAAYRLAGLNETQIDKLIPPMPQAAAGKRTVPYKGSRTGQPGTLDIQTVPDQAEIFLEDSSYGLRSVRITGIPEGEYAVSASCKYMAVRSKKVKVWPGEATAADLVLRYRRYFRLQTGYALVPKRKTTFELPTDIGVGMVAPDPEHTLISPANFGTSLTMGMAGYHRSLGLRLNFLHGRTAGTLQEIQGATVVKLPYEISTGLGLYLEFAYVFHLLGHYITLEPGVYGGYGKQDYWYDNRDTTNTYTTFNYSYTTVGGPRLALNAGWPRIKASFEYSMPISSFSVEGPDGFYSGFSGTLGTTLAVAHILTFSLIFYI